MFIVGDSFTEMRYVNDSEEWYNALSDKYELFVYGAGGWGTAQEYLLFNQYVDQIKPDVVIVQFFLNDPVNNLYLADRNEYPLSTIALRPYLENGAFVYRYAAPFDWWRRHSVLFAKLIGVYDAYQRSQAESNVTAYFMRVYSSEPPFTKDKIFQGHWSEARAATVDATRMIVQRAGGAPVYVVGVDTRIEDELDRMFAEAGATYLIDLPRELDARQARGENITIPGDRHWNKEGNAVVGQYLASYFAQR
jgi:hypothetical protein